MLLIRGAGVWVARLGATLGLNGGIGEGVWCGASGSSVQFVQVCAAPVHPTNRMITPFVDLSAQSTHYLL